jgi:16S rRNA (guanine966-N2)-methyltransferase
MRVVAGIARGRRLVAPKGDATRPTSDFVREAVFNSLGSHTDLEGSRVLDLFAGTGALGIEALSRGAAHADFVETDRRAVEVIHANVETTGFGAQASVHAADALTWLRRQAGGVVAYDIAFLDPPYAWGLWSEAAKELLPILGSGLVVAESDRELDLGDAWRVLKFKKYGTTVVTLASPRSCP